MKIAFYKSKNGRFIDHLISLVTFSKFSHCELVMSDGECLSSSMRDGGVRSKYINLNENWEVFQLNGEYDEETTRYYFKLFEGELYDTVGAIGSVFSVDITSPDKKFCSSLCSVLLGLNTIVTPAGLFKLLKKNNSIH